MAEKATKIRLDELLVDRGLVDSRTQAERLIMAGKVRVRGEVSDKPGHRLSPDVEVCVAEALPYVSRGGVKLAAALDAFDIRPDGWVCADIGASTGGFTDCLLQRGAQRVYAIDVGFGQLAWSLRNDSRVINIERANIRNLEQLPEPVALATIDVSFIGLALVLPRVASLLIESGLIVALIKPQFEVGKGQVGKGGVVRDSSLHREVLHRVLLVAADLGLEPGGLIRSPIKGPAGNVEFLALLRSGGVGPSDDTIARWIEESICAEPIPNRPRIPSQARPPSRY